MLSRRASLGLGNFSRNVISSLCNCERFHAHCQARDKRATARKHAVPRFSPIHGKIRNHIPPAGCFSSQPPPCRTHPALLMPKPSPQPKSIRTACQHPQETTFTACNASTTQKNACFPPKSFIDGVNASITSSSANWKNQGKQRRGGIVQTPPRFPKSMPVKAEYPAPAQSSG